LPKRGFKNYFKTKIQNINFIMINNIISKYNIDPQVITEKELFNKKIFKKSKGSLKLLNVGKLEKITNLVISYASKKAIKVLEELGGKIKLTKK
jgi:ribosomal protein L15